ncbi:MAG TPA: PucR family transcriptional regulator ligand-binding domain-containing protein [Candidatus Sulfomarinibacteraceae bacterium]|nr:PucR family transcriptional regulator ligand-binding domain-containing protein [Candidatus Sulfomarinibacteraceae bacterium]
MQTEPVQEAPGPRPPLAPLQDIPPTDAFRVADAVRLPVLQGARVVGGAGGLERPVRSVNVMEVPDIVEWVKPDELLLTTAYPLRDDPAALIALIPRLAARGLAGIALKPTRYIAATPPAMIEAADSLGFPLIELPADASFNEIINAVLSEILASQTVRLQRSAAIHDRFTSIVLSGGGPRQITEALGDLIGRSVTIVDAGGAVLWRTAPNGEPNENTVAQPIQVGAERYGAILVGGGAAGLGPEQLEAIEHAATVAALRQVQARAVAEADRRFQAVCLEELVTGHVADRSVLMERAAAFAWDLAVPRAVLLAEVEAVAGRPFAALAGTPEEGELRHRLVEAARSSLGPSAITWERSREIGSLVAAPGDGMAGLREAGAAFQAEAARRLPGGVVSIGIGRPAADPLRIDQSFNEARRALAIGRWSRGPGHLLLFSDLGVDRLLADVPEAEVEAYCRSVLGALEAYDGAHGTALVRTLDTYLATRNVALAARQLFVHYNTLKNRLAKIEEISGPFLDDPERCLSLSLAIRLRRVPAL